MSATQGQARSVADLVKRKLVEARDTLIERNLRNKLVNCPLTSKRSRQIRVVDEIPDEIFRSLLSNKKREFVFAPGRGVQEEDADGQTSDVIGWAPPNDSPEPAGGVAQRHRDSVLQTQLTPEGLQKRLTDLYYEAREVEEEQGVNVLYLALGFLKWFENGRSEVERFAPLVLIPVELTREGARDRFKLKVRDEDLIENVSLRVWLAEQHAIKLPDFPGSEEWLPSEYFSLVARAVANEPRWQVLEHEILLGFFSFNKFLLWRDLDPSNWPTADALLGHKVLRTLLAPSEETPVPEAPVISDDARIDSTFKPSELPYVLDADSSQTSAIQAALAGRNLVVQGPPGTGKSQTIANVVAAAIAKGKTVLFVSEKLAALQVVFERLKAVGLEHLCFELHSRKASKPQVLAQLRQAIDAPTPPGVRGDSGSSLDAHVQQLWDYSDLMHRKCGPSGYSPFDVIGRICRLRDAGTALPNFTVAGATQAKRADLESIVKQCEGLAQRLSLSGVPARHPWRGSEKDPLNLLDQQRLGEIAKKLGAGFEALSVLMRSVWPLVRPGDQAELSEFSFARIDLVIQALQLAAGKPPESMEVLCNPRWAAGVIELRTLLASSKSLAAAQESLGPIFVEAAWERDWTAVREEIAGSGRSMFRIFRRAYRDALRAYRGSCKTFPGSFEDRIDALDRLIGAIREREEFRSKCLSLRQDLGTLATSLPGDWMRLEVLCDWIDSVLKVEPTLSVRNPRLLGWSDSPGAWAGRLKDIRSRVADGLFQLADFVQMAEAGLDRDSKAAEWTLGDLGRRIAAWNLGTERYNEWPPVRDGLRWLASQTQGGLVDRCYDGLVQPQDLPARVELAIHEQLWNHMAKANPDLAKTDGRILAEKVSKFRDLDRLRIRGAAYEVAKHHHETKPTGTLGDMAVIRGELTKSRKHLPVRTLIERAGHAVQQLKPVFLMSPLSVAQYLPPGRLEFDMLLIDEASQVRPADALGAVARARQVVVVGDAKQLPPTNFFNRLVSDEDDASTDAGENGTDTSAPLGAMESILSLCDATFSNRTMLAWHYRSQHPALIAVSNRNFYDNKLLLPPSVVVDRAANGLGVVFHRSPPGGYDRGRSATNVVEADIVAEAVCQFARKHPEKSLGVGTFSVAQRDAIRDRIDARRRESPELEPFFSTSRNSPFFVKNLESIQGDERDVIFISVGYGRDRDGRLTQNFGPINADGGERRLNVLISRARERCEVFSPITADDIDPSARKPGTVALREFLQYAEKGYFDVPVKTDRSFDSDFEESVADFLKSRGYQVHPQVGMAGFYIDLGVLDAANPTMYLLGIECDGATYHSSRSARDRDRLRQEILESRGWRIYRIWSTDWFHRRKHEEHRLLDALELARKAPPPPPPKPISSEPVAPPMTVDPSPAPADPPVGSLYIEANFRIRSDDAPHEAPKEKVADAVFRILEIESPIHEDEVCRRLASVWGLERAGSRIREAGIAALKRLRSSGRAANKAAFWSAVPAKPVEVRNRSSVLNTTLRKPEYLPPEEIVEAARQIVAESVRAPMSDVVIEIARRLGIQRASQDVQESIRKSLGSKLAPDLVVDDQGNVYLPGP